MAWQKTRREAPFAMNGNYEGKAQSKNGPTYTQDRLSTIKNATKICVFGEGKLKEEGTHADLMDARSHYFALVSHQLHGDDN